MKRTGKKNIQILRNLIESNFNGDVRDIPRKQIVNIATSNGLIVNDTWPLVKPSSKGSTRGTYNVDKMLELADKILNKGEKDQQHVKKTIRKSVETVDAIYKETKDPDRLLMIKQSMIDSADARGEDKPHRDLSWEEVSYTQEDISDELSLMGTYL